MPVTTRPKTTVSRLRLGLPHTSLLRHLLSLCLVALNLIPITLDNTGSGTASSLQITSALLGSSQTTNTLPISLGNVGAGSSADVTLSYAGSVGTKGQKVKLTMKGSYQAPGSSKSTSYSLSATVTLP